MAYAKKKDGTGVGINIKGETMLPTGKYKEFYVTIIAPEFMFLHIMNL